MPSPNPMVLPQFVVKMVGSPSPAFSGLGGEGITLFWQLNQHRCACAKLALNLKRAIMRLDERLGNR